MFDAVMKKRDGHSAKQALLAYVAQELSIRGRSTNEWSNLPKSVQDEIKYGFLRLKAEKYFSITAAAIRRHDPNHLVLGARFAGLNGADPVVWEVAGKYCDAITFNCYPWADLERGEVMTDSSSRAKSIVEAFTERYERAGKPFLITEWSFPATDTSCPCRYGGGQRLRTQSERAKASDLFARTLLSLPFLIGYDYFMWVDEPAAGISDAFPEDSNYGLVNENGKPYGELVDVFTRLHSNLEKAISSCPKPIPDVLRGGVSLDTYKEKTGYYSSTNILYNVSQTVGNVSNLLGLALNFDIAYKGKGVKFSLNDKPIGDFCIMLNYLRPEGSETWVDAFRTVQATKDGSSLVVVNSGGYMPRTFKLKTRFTFSSEKSSVIAELLSIENTGKDTLVIKDILFRAYPAFKDRETSRRFLPNRWTGRQMSDSWRAVDGRVFTLSSKAPWSQSCQFYIDPKKGTHIPDAVCRPPEPFTLLPGKTYQIPNGSAWFEIKCTMD